MRRLSLLLITAWLLAFQAVAANVADRPVSGEQVETIVTRFLHYHYDQPRLDDDHSARMLDNYLNLLDPEHLYFLEEDIKQFSRYRTRLDNLINAQDISPAFIIFDRFRQRLEEREKQAQALLGEELDLASDDSWLLERKDAPYPANAQEAETLVRTKLKFEVTELTLDGSSKKEAVEKVGKRWSNILRRWEEFNHNDVVSAYVNGLLTSYDPHSSYMTPDDWENFNISLSLSLEGIGATLRNEDGFTIVTSLVPGGAAAREGTLKEEDKLIGVGQGRSGSMEDVRNMRLSDVVKLIRGPKDSYVRLDFLRDLEGKGITKMGVTIRRDRIELKDGEASGKVIQEPGEGKGEKLRIGVINLPSFYVDFEGRRHNDPDFKRSSHDVELILEDFKRQGVDGVVLDLRNNGGGGLDEAVSLAGLFLRAGPVVMVRTRKGKKNPIAPLESANPQPVYNGPLVVLTNRYSASASEILAGAMKDYGRAVVVGETTTFGKGTVQNLFQLAPELGALKVTVAKFYRPGSSSTQLKGVDSDLVLPSLNNHLEIGESSLPNAMAWDALRWANYRPWGDLSPYLPMLKERSRQRVEKNSRFGEVLTAVNEYQKNTKGKKVARLSDLRHRSEEIKKIRAGEKKGKKEEDTVLDESVRILTDFIGMSAKDPAYRLANGRSQK